MSDPEVRKSPSWEFPMSGERLALHRIWQQVQKVRAGFNGSAALDEIEKIAEEAARESDAKK